MHKKVILLILFFISGHSANLDDTQKEKKNYIKDLELENNISYEDVVNTRGAYVTSMCYTKTKDNETKIISNPCYSCHTVGKIPNYYNDTNLQKEYNFPIEMMKNPFTNLFKDRSEEVNKISDKTILNYIRKSNYFDDNGNIKLSQELPKDWRGYRPDCYYNFDDDGFDRDKKGKYTLWRAFRYYPLLGTFWPTNGSTDDVLIRLDKVFSQDDSGNFDLEIYKINLAIVESLVKQKNISLHSTISELKYGVDFNQNGVFDRSNYIAISTYDKMSYIGMAKQVLNNKKFDLASGLFPENTEFLHSVRYIDWSFSDKNIKISKRMKELRYAKKKNWKTYSELNRIARTEFKERISLGSDKAVLSSFRGNYEDGLNNDIGWIYQGFIEDKKGNLRPQTHEETINCMGCHSHLGVTTDSTFAFTRKFEGVDKNKNDFGWNHWTQKSLAGVKENQVVYKNIGRKNEYSFYLNNNHSGNEFRSNNEVKEKFFGINGILNENIIEKLHNDVSLLLFPSYKRAIQLNKAYKVIVEEQSFIYGRYANVKPIDNVFLEIQENQMTNITKVIVQQ